MSVVIVTVSGDPRLWGGPMHAARELCTFVGRGSLAHESAGSVSGWVAGRVVNLRAHAQHCRRGKFTSQYIRNPPVREFKGRARLRTSSRM